MADRIAVDERFGIAVTIRPRNGVALGIFCSAFLLFWFWSGFGFVESSLRQGHWGTASLGALIGISGCTVFLYAGMWALIGRSVITLSHDRFECVAQFGELLRFRRRAFTTEGIS